MPDLDDARRRVAALAPADLAAFQTWFFDLWSGQFLGPSRGWEAQEDARPSPADFEAFDSVAFDTVTDALRETLDGRDADDLRWLQSEAEAEAAEAAQALPPDPSDYRPFRERYEAEHPPPARTAAPEALAEWEWARLDAYFAETGRIGPLARHRLSRGAFLAQETRRFRAAEQRASVFGDPLEKASRQLRRRTPPPPEPWPTDDPEGDLRKFQVGADPDRRAWRARERERNPAYGPVDDFHAGVLGWEWSLTRDTYDVALPLIHALNDASDDDAVTSSRRVASIGATLLRLRRALGRLHDGEAALDAAERAPWLTPAAYRRLRALLGLARDATLDHYVEVRAEYAALRAVAERVLGSVPGPVD